VAPRCIRKPPAYGSRCFGLRFAPVLARKRGPSPPHRSRFADRRPPPARDHPLQLPRLSRSPLERLRLGHARAPAPPQTAERSHRKVALVGPPRSQPGERKTYSRQRVPPGPRTATSASSGAHMVRTAGPGANRMGLSAAQPPPGHLPAARLATTPHCRPLCRLTIRRPFPGGRGKPTRGASPWPRTPFRLKSYSTPTVWPTPEAISFTSISANLRSMNRS
jgi:hypothetical protein